MEPMRPLASLVDGLLARKGQARPAMRPQVLGRMVDLADVGAPLGCDDPGVTFTAEAVRPAPPARATPKNEVEGRAAALSFETVKRLQRETTRGGRAAFTLRLDQERHLRLRLAAAVHGRSAQQIVTAALDAFLTNLPQVEALVAQLPPRRIADRSKD
jgi:plasmid stability protein